MPFERASVGEATGVGRVAAAAGQADVDVDQARADAGERGGGDRRLAVDGDRDRGLVGERGERLEPAGIDDLVGDEQVVAETQRRPCPTASRGVAQVNERWPTSYWRWASDVHLCALTWGRRRRPGWAAAIVARLSSSAPRSMINAGVGRSCTSMVRRVCHVGWSRCSSAGVAQLAEARL